MTARSWDGRCVKCGGDVVQDSRLLGRRAVYRCLLCLWVFIR